jgi:hypothetical protein
MKRGVFLAVTAPLAVGCRTAQPVSSTRQPVQSGPPSFVGSQGPQGPSGAVGAQGPTGPMGPSSGGVA